MAARRAIPKRFRLQGTDGIRREVRLSSDAELKGLDPVEAFLQRGVITEAFMERYAFAHVNPLARSGRIAPKQGFVVGWDPRDVTGRFTEAVVRGVRRAGVDALVLGIVPTPLVPMFVQHARAGGGFMVTASHNPQDQNGIKTFLAWRGMKLLPENDIALTRALLNAPFPANGPLTGKRIDRRHDALALFERFTLAQANSWIEDETALKRIVLVVDPARGALSGLAAGIFRKAGFSRVIEVNATLDGRVNHYSGVADLEGHTTITPEMIETGTGIFARHQAVRKMFELGRRNRPQIRNGARRVAGAVFDADGDRFYRLEYNPFADRLAVLSGDETAFLQAQYLVRRDRARYRNAAYVHTVESDLNTGAAAERLGLRRQLSAVGDKWILLRIALLIVTTRLKRHRGPGTAALKKKLDALQRAERFDVSRFEALEAALDKLDAKAGRAADALPDLPFAVGSEETGHNITRGVLPAREGEEVSVFAGNGLKSALNTFAATEWLLGGKTPKRYFAQLERPFPPGFKGTLYVYYIRQERFRRNSKVWQRMAGLIRREAKRRGYRCRALPFHEDPDMLYLALTPETGTKAGIFVRNSGTENKISVNLRGTRRDARALKAIGETAVQLLFIEMKDAAHALHRRECALLREIAAGPLPEADAGAEDARVLAEMGKQKLIEPGPRGFRLARLGKWYILHGPVNADPGKR